MTTTEPETPAAPAVTPLQVAVVTLGCARNEVDSEELAGRLEAGGFVLVDDAEDADTVVVNTCGFVEAAKKDSVDTLLEAADLKASAGNGGRAQAVVAVGCLAERYGKDLAESLPEADAVLGFDDYPDIAAKLRAIVGGGDPPPAHAVRPPPAAADLAGGPRRLAPSRCPATTYAPTSPTSARARPRRDPAPYAVASTRARWRRSSWRAAATVAARSARSRASAAPS